MYDFGLGEQGSTSALHTFKIMSALSQPPRGKHKKKGKKEKGNHKHEVSDDKFTVYYLDFQPSTPVQRERLTSVLFPCGTEEK